MVERVLLYKLQGIGAASGALNPVTAALQRCLDESGCGLEVSFSSPADEASDRAWDLCVRLRHPDRAWAGEEAERLDRQLDECLGERVVVRKAWSFRALP